MSCAVLSPRPLFLPLHYILVSSTALSLVVSPCCIVHVVLCLLVWVCGAVCCAVLCCAPGCGAAPRCCVALSGVVLFLCRVVLFRSFVVVACCVVPSGTVCRPVVLCFPALCFVFFPRTVYLFRCLRSMVFWCVLLFAAVLCAVCVCCVCPGVPCCVFPLLSALRSAVSRCGGAFALCSSCGLRCLWCLVLCCVAVCCAVSTGVL